MSAEDRANEPEIMDHPSGIISADTAAGHKGDYTADSGLFPVCAADQCHSCHDPVCGCSGAQTALQILYLDHQRNASAGADVRGVLRTSVCRTVFGRMDIGDHRAVLQ